MEGAHEAEGAWTRFRFEDARGREVQHARLATDPDVGVMISPLLTRESITLVLRSFEVRKINFENMDWLSEDCLAALPDMCERLSSLSLDGCCTGTTDRVLGELGNKASRLRAISLRGCPELSLFGLIGLVAGCRQLVHLDVADNPRLFDVPNETKDDDLLELYTSSVPKALQQVARIRTVHDTRDKNEEQDAARSALAELLGDLRLRSLSFAGIQGVDSTFLLQLFVTDPVTAREDPSPREESPRPSPRGAAKVAALAQGKGAGTPLPETEETETPARQQVRRHIHPPHPAGLELRCLDLSRCPLVSSSGVAHIVERCPNLRRLDLVLSSKVGPEGAHAIAMHAAGMQELDLSGLHQLDDASVAELLAHQGKHLRCLRLAGCLDVETAALEAAARHCVALEELDLTGCVNVPPQALKWLCEGACSSLARVVLNGCYQFDADALDEARARAHAAGQPIDFVRCRQRPSGDPNSSGLVPNWRPLPASQTLRAIARETAKKRPGKNSKKKKKKK